MIWLRHRFFRERSFGGDSSRKDHLGEVLFGDCMIKTTLYNGVVAKAHSGGDIFTRDERFRGRESKAYGARGSITEKVIMNSKR